MKQTTTALLLIAMLAGMTACGDTAATTDTTEGAPGDTTTAAAETELVPELPDKTFDGKTFTIYYREHSANRYAVDREAAVLDATGYTKAYSLIPDSIRVGGLNYREQYPQSLALVHNDAMAQTAYLPLPLTTINARKMDWWLTTKPFAKQCPFP